MKKVFVLSVCILVASFSVFAQKKNDVLLTINDKPVYANEFRRVYKKNLDLVKDERQKTVDGYLDLFIDYNLKIAEAYNKGLHKRPTYLEEFSRYEEQLSRNYIYDDAVVDELVMEAYERGLEEIEARHILISADYNSSPQDTLKAYNKIKEVREKALAGEDFEALARQYSTEPGAADRAGYLGYFTAFSMVYPFESAAYNTEVGEISEIVRTQFGYHILKVLNRREKGSEISVSHILISDKDDNSRTFSPEERIKEISQLLKQGEDFGKLAEQYSDDKNSAVRGGRLNRFSRGRLRSMIFENKAFELKEVGEISEPFKSEFGWHIVKLEQIHDKPTFEELKPNIEKRVKDGDRSKKVTSAISNKIKEKYGFEKGEPYVDYLVEFLPDEVLQRRFRFDSVAPIAAKTLFTIGKKKYSFEDFARYIETNQRKFANYKSKYSLVMAAYDEFEVASLKAYYRSQLELENEDYATTINEYRNGLLIFDLMSDNIWKKAKEDSLGLEAFYQKTRDQYKWGERIEATIAGTTVKENALRVAELWKEGKTDEEVKELLNSDEKVNVIMTAGTIEVTNDKLPEGLPIKKGVSEVYNNSGSYVVIRIDDILPPGIKELDDVRGKVMSNYQVQLEEDWMDSLRKKFKVEVNKKTLKKLKKEFKS
jgi:peptidyl-prolyl cis-trans isomerase SurA